MKDSRKMVWREIDFMKKKGAPKDMLKHEKAEAKSMGAKKYADGGITEGPNKNIDDETREKAREFVSKSSDADKPATFKQAFAAARKGGAKTFEYNGKKYTTELAKPDKPKVTDTGDDMERMKRRASTSAPATSKTRAQQAYGQVDENTLLPKKYAKGGSVSRGMGCATRGGKFNVK